MYIEITIILISLALGSFANNIISYLAGKANFDILISTCFCGERRLKLSENIPLIGYMTLRGKCSGCNKSIPGRYFIVEILTVGLAITLYIEYGLTILFTYWFIIFFLLLLIAFIDYLSFTIPNSLIMVLLFIGLINSPTSLADKTCQLISAFILSFIFLIINRIIIALKGKEGIGFGDIKLIFVLVLIFHLPVTLAGIWLGAVTALSVFFLFRYFQNAIDIYSKKIPLGTFLVIGIFITHQIFPYLTYHLNTLWSIY